MKRMIISEKALEFYRQLQELGVFYHKQIRFIDSWATGTILYFLVSLARFFNEYEVVEGKAVYRQNPLFDIKVDCRAADAKIRALPLEKIDQRALRKGINYWWVVPPPSLEWHLQKNNLTTAIPSVDWERSSLSLEKVKKWYTKRGIRPPPIENKELTDFEMLMSAQIYKPHNPYGALNLGHRIDWNKPAKQLYSATAAKKLGAFLREIMLINSVIDYVELENKNVAFKEDFMPPADTALAKKDTESVFNELLEDLAKLGYCQNEDERGLLRKLMFVYSEHIATSNDSLQLQMIINIMYTIRALGVKTVEDAFENQHYDAQYYIHIVKSLSIVEFRNMLYRMMDIYGIGFVKELFKYNLVYR